MDVQAYVERVRSFQKAAIRAGLLKTGIFHGDCSADFLFAGRGLEHVLLSEQRFPGGLLVHVLGKTETQLLAQLASNTTH